MKLGFNSRRINYVTIVCPGHSGSTLLAMALNSHKDMFVFGEFASLRQRVKEIRDGKKNSLCSFCYEYCNFMDKKERKIIERCYYSKSYTIANLKKLVTHPLYVRHLVRKTGVDIVCDSSKSVKWATLLSRHFRWAFKLKYIFIIRDPRAIIASHVRQGRDLETTIEKCGQEITRMLEFIEVVNQQGSAGDGLVIRYEELAQQPRAVLEEICAFIGVSFQEDMLRYEQYPHHIIGGNDKARSRAKKFRGQKINMKPHTEWFLQQKENFFLDERWKSELSDEQISTIETELADVMKSMQYEVQRC